MAILGPYKRTIEEPDLAPAAAPVEPTQAPEEAPVEMPDWINPNRVPATPELVPVKVGS